MTHNGIRASDTGMVGLATLTLDTVSMRITIRHVGGLGVSGDTATIGRITTSRRTSVVVVVGHGGHISSSRSRGTHQLIHDLGHFRHGLAKQFGFRRRSGGGAGTGCAIGGTRVCWNDHSGMQLLQGETGFVFKSEMLNHLVPCLVDNLKLGPIGVCGSETRVGADDIDHLSHNRFFRDTGVETTSF